MDEIMSMALENGIWVALFCFLFVYMLKDSRNREVKYTTTIETLSEQLGNVAAVLKLCEEIKLKGESSLQVSQAIKSDTELIKEELDTLRSSWEKL